MGATAHGGALASVFKSAKIPQPSVMEQRALRVLAEDLWHLYGGVCRFFLGGVH